MFLKFIIDEITVYVLGTIHPYSREYYHHIVDERARECDTLIIESTEEDVRRVMSREMSIPESEWWEMVKDHRDMFREYDVDLESCVGMSRVMLLHKTFKNAIGKRLNSSGPGYESELPPYTNFTSLHTLDGISDVINNLNNATGIFVGMSFDMFFTALPQMRMDWLSASGEHEVTPELLRDETWGNRIIEIAKTKPAHSKIFVAMGALHISRVVRKMRSRGYFPEIILETPTNSKPYPMISLTPKLKFSPNLIYIKSKDPERKCTAPKPPNEY